MKKKTPFLLFFMLLLLVINLKAQDAESRYETGKQFLQQGKYNAAMEASGLFYLTMTIRALPMFITFTPYQH
jgi:hypothetical protein